MIINIGLSVAVAVVVLGRTARCLPKSPFIKSTLVPRAVPPQAQVIDQRKYNVMQTVPPPAEVNGTTIFKLPDVDEATLASKPFHIYDDEFYEIIGTNPSLTLIASSGSDPRFHEAPIWHAPTDEVFLAQASGALAAGTGLNKSALLQKIALSQAEAVSTLRNATGKVDVVPVKPSPDVINTNGGTNFKGQLLFVGNGQGDKIAPGMYLVNPREPYNATLILNNYFGRQFVSFDDVAVNPRNGEIYVTDVPYGYLQGFRPTPGLPYQVWRFSPATGAVSLAADGFNLPNGITFSPDGSYAYVTDTGMQRVLFGTDMTYPATIYRYDVKDDGTFENRKAFAFASTGVPDGVHCDSKGNVYAACGDGVHVFNPSGKLVGKIYLGAPSANFIFAGKGRMVLLAETELYYATLAASGAPIHDG